MAPPPSEHQPTTTLNIMSSPNSNALSMTARSMSGSGMRTVHVGKEAQPVALPIMASVNSQS